MPAVFQERKHMVLMYDSEEQRDEEIIRFINEGLSLGELCIYGTIHVRDKEYFNSLSSRIVDFEENVGNGTLLVVDFAPFYIAAVGGDLSPYKEVQKKLEKMFRDREDLRVRFIGDATGFLFKNRHFDECAMIENWWQKNRITEVTTLCVFEKSLVDRYPYAYQIKRIFENHDLALEAGGSAASARIDKASTGDGHLDGRR